MKFCGLPPWKFHVRLRGLFCSAVGAVVRVRTAWVVDESTESRILIKDSPLEKDS